MNTTDITIYIDNKPYRFHVDVDQENDSTTYSVSSAEEANAAADFIPQHLEFHSNGSIRVKERLKTVEQEQIARLIWQEILDKMNP